jgi:hypothetical protein
MGNTSSTTNSNKSSEKEFDNFYDIIDYIATYYILTMDFKSLSKLSEKEYCDNLVVITSDIIKRYFNDMEVTYLAQRIKDGLEVNNLSKEKIIFVNKDQLESLDISNDKQKNLKKKRICIGIAKFYVKIAHIFAAIVMTVNPVYTYKDSSGQTVKTGLMQKDIIPKNSNRKLFKLNICDNRIRALKKGEEMNVATGDVSIQPKVCDFNMDKNKQLKNLNDEPGIPELMTLYFDDNYDYSNGTFTGMSDTTKKQFMIDLKTFYTAFTGNENMPPEITKFSDIKLRNFNSLAGCQGDIPVLKNKYVVNKNNKLFVEYAKNTQKMIQTAADNQSKLLDVINDLFTYVIDPYSGKQKIRVNPKLTEESLQKCVEKTRKLIIDLYVNCEMDYLKGIKIYEAIVESKILETTQKQIKTLENEANKIISDTAKVISEPKVVEARQVPLPVPVPVPLPEKNIDAKNEILTSLTSETSPTPTPIPTTQPIIQIQQPINLNKETTGIQISNLTNIPNNPPINNPPINNPPINNPGVIV